MRPSRLPAALCIGITLFLIRETGHLADADRALAAEHGAGSLRETGSMSVARAAHSATALPDGTVLVAGGQAQNHVYFASAEIYDPQTGRFRKTGDMSEERVAQHAILLENGHVLMLGGSNRRGMLGTAELYDPKTGTFRRTGSMHGARAGFVSARLASGRVLVAGGYDGTRWVRSAEIYDPASGTFAPTGDLNWPSPQSATTLRDGHVLLTGGGDGSPDSSVFSNAELFDPAGGTFARTGSMKVARNKYAAVLETSGEVLIVGGTDEKGWAGQLQSAEAYDPKTGSFRVLPAMHEARFKHNLATTALADGRVIVAGGGKHAEVFDPQAKTFTLADGAFDTARYFSTATLLRDGTVLIVGGYRRGIDSTERSWRFTPSPI
jgi:Kelch motif protein